MPLTWRGPALVLLLQVLTVTDPADPRFEDLHKNISQRRTAL
ncbi:hypothetical protein SAMN04489712_1443 [Thermomonospora echinospora]|uniref:Uncharacterized protein n=1 Tax=Thermomonospora echinospora TaxID=1992 RepID=A0A1H6EBM1_9ACTN|nr:hypothetical protein [Thermomonospora echinospora]SEG94195.1 hypothetical protein SAMN04489712_1443 [Thermomonospora echinospora]